MEQELIQVAKDYFNMDIENPQSEKLNIELFNLAAQVNDPQTTAGRAIIKWVKSEEATDFSLSCNSEFEAMLQAVKVNKNGGSSR